MRTILPLSLLVAGVHASLLTLQSPRFTVTSSNGDQLRSELYVSQLLWPMTKH